MTRADRSPAVAAPVLAKVRKLLAKAEATDNPNEADAFSAKAAQLIAAHRIDVARLADAAHGDLVTRRVPVGRGAYVRARLALLAAVAAAHDCETVWETGPDGATALVAGFAGDVDATIVLYDSLHLQAASRLTAVRRPTPAATQRWRRAFLFGYAARIGDLLTDARRATEDHAAAAGTMVPDLPARSARVREFASAEFGRVVRAAAPAPASAAGWDHGHRAAGGADIGRSRLGGRPALGRGQGAAMTGPGPR